MNPENTETLFDEFPKLYRGRSRPDTESLICFGFECGNGWFKLIRDLSRKLTEIADSADLSGDAYPEAAQVKEKFGGLRFYLQPRVSGDEDDAIDNAIDEAEKRSVSTCETCGKPGRSMSIRHWIRTLCEECEHSAKEKA